MQLVWLKDHYSLLPLATLIELIRSKKRFPTRACAITFDDGYHNLYGYALPAIRSLKLPATIFLPTDFIDRKSPLWVDRLEYAIGHAAIPQFSLRINGVLRAFPLHTFQDRCMSDAAIREVLKKLPRDEAAALLASIIDQTQKDLTDSFLSSPYCPLTWDEIREMRDAGVTFAAHTLTHPILSRTPTDEAAQEIAESHRRITKEIGVALPIFAYPNGQPDDFTQNTVALLKKEGVIAALTTTPGVIGSNPDLFRLPRITMDNTDAEYRFRATVTGFRAALANIRSYLY